MALGYRDFADFLAGHFPYKVQKLAINAGFTCPNRDGSKGIGGCTYCNNQTFNPSYCAPRLSITQQIEEGKKFFAHKYPDMRYLAYFQAYTNTHGDIDRLMNLYHEALSQPMIEGLIIGTRPDCVPDILLNKLKDISHDKFVMIEYGAETANDNTLMRINRCHTWHDTVDAVYRTAAHKIHVGLHLILGLPGEDEEIMLNTIDHVSALPIDTIKLHQLQIIRGTRLARDIEQGLYTVPQFTPDTYIDLCCRIIEHTAPSIAIERFVSQSPDDLLISPRWGLKNYQFTNLLINRIKKQGIQQGSRHIPI